jgi:hypothetical protein
MLNVLTATLSGNYVNFGVFALYEDKALQNSLDVSLQMCLQIPLNDILAYMKLSKAYFGFLEVLMKGHLDVLCGLDSSVFITLIKTLHEGLQSSGKLIFYDSNFLRRGCLCPVCHRNRPSFHIHLPESAERETNHPNDTWSYSNGTRSSRPINGLTF